VLFYFSESTQRRILRNAHAALRPDGFLILGSSEQAAGSDLWEPRIDGNGCYYTPR
jgi:chemotaxis methyl-accepting protein methylase